MLWILIFLFFTLKDHALSHDPRVREDNLIKRRGLANIRLSRRQCSLMMSFCFSSSVTRHSFWCTQTTVCWNCFLYCFWTHWEILWLKQQQQPWSFMGESRNPFCRNYFDQWIRPVDSLESALKTDNQLVNDNDIELELNEGFFVVHFPCVSVS